MVRVTVDLEIAKQKAIIETNKKLVEQTIAYVRAESIRRRAKETFNRAIRLLKVNQIEVIKLKKNKN